MAFLCGCLEPLHSKGSSRRVGLLTLSQASSRSSVPRDQGRNCKAFSSPSVRSHSVSLLLRFIDYIGPAQIQCRSGLDEDVDIGRHSSFRRPPLEAAIIDIKRGSKTGEA